MANKIDSFTGDFFFLSNFYNAPVRYNGFEFQNNEAAFQSAKAPKQMALFCNLNPSQAKRLGRSVKLREDWEDVKDDVMYQVCKAKFTQNKELGKRLIGTEDAVLIEGNTWRDRIWGVYKGRGENRLGKILMRIREEIRGELDE